MNGSHQFSAHTQAVHQRTGLMLSAHYGASKMRWCLDHLPAVAAARREGRLAMGPLASFLLFRLLEEKPLFADPANAARTLLWNLRTHGLGPVAAGAFRDSGGNAAALRAHASWLRHAARE